MELQSFPMDPTPGELLAAILKKRGVKRTAFAREVGRTYQTVFNWTKDIGFGPEQRADAVRILRLNTDYFDHPDLVAQRENYRLAVLRKFRSHRIGKTLSDEEWKCLESVHWPEGVAPTETRYWGMTLVIRGAISPQEFADNIEANEQASDRSPPKDAQKTPAPKSGKRQKGIKRRLKQPTQTS